MVNSEWLRELPQRFECLTIVLWKIGDITNCAKVREPVAILSLLFICTVPYVEPKTLISAVVKKLLIKNLFNYLNDIPTILACFHNYDWFCHLATFIIMLLQKRWPSDKTNHSCENML